MDARPPENALTRSPYTIVSGVTEVQAGVVIIVVATVTNGVGVGHIVAGSLAGEVIPAITHILLLFAPAVKKKPPRPESAWKVLCRTIKSIICL